MYVYKNNFFLKITFSFLVTGKPASAASGQHVIVVFVQQILFFFVLMHRAIHMHDVRLDQLVSLQCVLWDGDEIQGTIHQTVSRGQFFVSTTN